MYTTLFQKSMKALFVPKRLFWSLLLVKKMHLLLFNMLLLYTLRPLSSDIWTQRLIYV